MDDILLGPLIPASGLISGLIGAYVGLQNRALLAEVRRELAELENRIILRINGTYARTSEVAIREEAIRERLARLEVRTAADHGDRRRIPNNDAITP
jgi:hypothetical protein